MIWVILGVVFGTVFGVALTGIVLVIVTLRSIRSALEW